MFNCDEYRKKISFLPQSGMILIFRMEGKTACTPCSPGHTEGPRTLLGQFHSVQFSRRTSMCLPWTLFFCVILSMKVAAWFQDGEW